MANIKITDLTAYADPAATDVLPIVDVGADVTKKVSIQDLLENAGSGTAAAPGIAFDGDSDSGIYRPGANQLALSTNGTGQLFIDANGNVGVGTSPGSRPLTVSGPISCGTLGGEGLVLAGATAIRNYGTSPNSDIFYDAGMGDSTGGAHIFRSTNSYTERLRITPAGLVGIGTTGPAYQLQLSTDSAGKPSTNTWTIVSDERIKEEIELADLDICYETVKSIPLKRFKWKDEVYTEEQAYDRRKLGWIAQDVEAVFPKAVRQHEFKYNQVFEEVVIPAVPAELDDDGNVITEEQPERIEKGELISEEVIEDCRDLNSDQLYAAMYGAIQKLISKVELLEAEVQALKAA